MKMSFVYAGQQHLSIHICDLLLNYIKFLKTKEGSAMVQLGDGISVERAIQHLNRCCFFDSELLLRYVTHFGAFDGAVLC